MEHDIQNYLEMIDRPAFLVRDGIILYCNEVAKHRQIPEGIPVRQLLKDDCTAYDQFESGILYLTVHLGWVQCGATVVQQDTDHIFLLDREADKLQLQLLTLAGQQLRGPLANLITLSAVLFPQLEDPKQVEQASQMTKSLFQLMRMISNMADAESCARTEQLGMERTDLCRLFRKLFQKAASTLGSSGVDLRFTCEETHIFTLANCERLERAVYNLISNAVKFSEPGTCVEAKLVRHGDLAYLSIENQGEGIANHVRSDLFHRYLREPAIEDSRFGMGLGMTIVRSVAALHGGTVLIDQPRGTRVTMTMQIRKLIPDSFHSPQKRIGLYSGGFDQGLLEFSDILPAQDYKK